MGFMRLFFNRTEGDDMAKSTIDIDTSQIERLSEELKSYKKEVVSATRLALNRTIDFAITTAGREVSKLYAIKQKEVKESFKSGIKKPTKTNLEASITSTGHTLSIAHFPHNPDNPLLAKMLAIRYQKTQIKVKIMKSKGFKIINNNPKPFIASTGTTSADKTQYNVFARVGKSRLPIMPIKTLSIPQMITNNEVGEKISKLTSEKLNERLEHEISRKMENIQKKVSK